MVGCVVTAASNAAVVTECTVILRLRSRHVTSFAIFCNRRCRCVVHARATVAKLIGVTGCAVKANSDPGVTSSTIAGRGGRSHVVHLRGTVTRLVGVTSDTIQIGSVHAGVATGTVTSGVSRLHVVHRRGTVF